MSAASDPSLQFVRQGWIGRILAAKESTICVYLRLSAAKMSIHTCLPAQYAPRPRKTAGIERSIIFISSTKFQFST